MHLSEGKLLFPSRSGSATSCSSSTDGPASSHPLSVVHCLFPHILHYYPRSLHLIYSLGDLPDAGGVFDAPLVRCDTPFGASFHHPHRIIAHRIVRCSFSVLPVAERFTHLDLDLGGLARYGSISFYHNVPSLTTRWDKRIIQICGMVICVPYPRMNSALQP